MGVTRNKRKKRKELRRGKLFKISLQSVHVAAILFLNKHKTIFNQSGQKPKLFSQVITYLLVSARKINTKDMQIVRQRRPLDTKLCRLQRMIGMYCALKKRVASSKRFLLTENWGISLHFFYWPRKNIEQNFYFKMSIKSFGKVFEKMLGTSLIISKCRVL